VFENPGLCIVIANRVPKDEIKKWETSDKRHHEIMTEFETTGIAKLLKERGKQYFALSPDRDKDGSLTFWLNPYHQDRDNFGWYNLKDLQDWAEDKGRVPMSAAQQAERAERFRR
jgi:hypothetical protein